MARKSEYKITHTVMPATSDWGPYTLIDIHQLGERFLWMQSYEKVAGFKKYGEYPHADVHADWYFDVERHLEEFGIRKVDRYIFFQDDI